jgi:hypothetical protein
MEVAMRQNQDFSLFDAGELDLIEAIARRRGFENADAYLRALVNVDAAIHKESPVFEAGVSVRESFIVGWKQALDDDTISSEDLLHALNDDM